MAEVKWIKITTNIFDDEKIKLIEAMPEKDTILVVWFKLLTLAGKINDSGNIHIANIPTTDEMLATLFNRPLNSIRLALSVFKDFGMITLKENYQITNWEKHQNLDGLEKIKKQNAERQKKFRENQKKIKLIENKEQNSYVVTSNVTTPLLVTHSNETDIESDIDKESYDHDNNILNNINIIKELFEKFGVNFSNKHRDVVSELLKKNSIDFWVKHFTKQYELIKANPAVKNISAVFSNHLFNGTCEIDNAHILEIENQQKDFKNNDFQDNSLNEIIDVFKNLSLEEQEEIENEIFKTKDKNVLSEIKKNSEIIYFKFIYPDLKKLLSQRLNL